MNITWIAAIVFALSPLAPRADEPDAAKALAIRLTTEGAKVFDTKDARAMAAFYTEDAQLRFTSTDKETGLLKTEVKEGRAAVQEYYEKFFEGAGTPHAKNTVEYARRIGEEVLLITGTFKPDVDGDIKVSFVQVRVSKGDKWLMSTLHIFMVP